MEYELFFCVVFGNNDAFAEIADHWLSRFANRKQFGSSMFGFVIVQARNVDCSLLHQKFDFVFELTHQILYQNMLDKNGLFNIKF